MLLSKLLLFVLAFYARQYLADGCGRKRRPRRNRALTGASSSGTGAALCSLRCLLAVNTVTDVRGVHERKGATTNGGKEMESRQ